MRSRLSMLVAIALAAASLVYAVGRIVFHSSNPRPPAAVTKPLPPSPASYLGVFEAGAPPSYQPIEEFATAAGRHVDLVGYFSGWLQPFDTSFAGMLLQHGVIPFVQIDPTYGSIPAISRGVYDDYLRTYADSVRDYEHQVVIGFGHEMNAPGYSWGYGHVAPATFVAAWRHIVTLFHSQGADNVTWLWTLEADGPGTGPIASWWPGARYVTWVGIDGYYYSPRDNFKRVFGLTIDEVKAFTSKPVLLSETAVGPEAGQLVKIPDLFEGIVKYKVLGLVWFDKTQHDGIYHQDWRIEDNSAAEASFRLGVIDDLNPYHPR
jgi:mannan endo-1,4-beta-mannosidase